MKNTKNGLFQTCAESRQRWWSNRSYCPAARFAPAAFCAAFALTGCSILSPHIYSDRLMTDGKTAAPPKTLEEAYEDTAEVQRRYFTAVRDQGNAPPRLSLGLIGLSAIALFKGMTNPNTNDLISFGVAGSATYAAGNTLLSPSRLDVYRTGGEALGCAMTAVEPLRIGADAAVLGKPTDGAADRTLYGRTFRLIGARDELQQILLKHQDKAQPRDVPDTARRKVTVRVPPVCKVLPANPTAVEKLEDQQCRNKPAVLTTREEPAPTGAFMSVAPPEELERVVIEARAWIGATDGQIDSALKDIGTLNSAASALWSRSVAIQKVVSEEVGKTVPNLAAVMAAAEGLKSTGFSLTGADAFAPVAEAQKAKTRRPATAGDKAAVTSISSAIEKLKLARRELASGLRFALGSGHEDVQARLNACAVKISGVKLTVTPSGHRVQVAREGMAVFFVSGGRGIPSGSVLEPNPKGATLSFRPEGGLARFEFKPPSNAAVGEVYTLSFKDADGVEQTVAVQVIAAAKVLTGPSTDDPVSKTPTKAPGTEDKATKPKILGAIGRDRAVRSAGA